MDRKVNLITVRIKGVSKKKSASEHHLKEFDGGRGAVRPRLPTSDGPVTRHAMAGFPPPKSLSNR